MKGKGETGRGDKEEQVTSSEQDEGGDNDPVQGRAWAFRGRDRWPSRGETAGINRALEKRRKL